VRVPSSRVLIAIAVGLALADASVVVLALPPLLNELDTTVEGVAAVIAVYTLVLAAFLPLAEALRRSRGTAWVGVGGWGLFTVGCIGCGIASDLTVLLAFRAIAAIGAAGGIVSGFAVLRGSPDEPGPGHVWVAASVFGTAAGPALGGLLTELFDWRVIFFVQVPFALLAAVASLGAGAVGADSFRRKAPRRAAGPAVALALLSAALTGVLFLLVLMLVAGWSLSPLEAALAVSVLPVAAVFGARIPGEPRPLAAAGCLLVGAGVLSLAFIPTASVAWTIAPQVLAGLGMGMGFAALSGRLLPEDTPGEAAWLLSVRHYGITFALVLIAPIAAAQLDDAVNDARQRTAAVVLDAKLPPLDKLDLVGPITADLNPEAPRQTLDDALAREAGQYEDDTEKAAAYQDMRDKVDGTIVRGVAGAFRDAVLITGGLALIAAVALVPGGGARTMRAVALGSVALALPIAMLLVEPGLAPARGEIRDPCQDRELPDTGGLGGLVQDVSLEALDRAACDWGSTREELAIALADEDSARAYEEKYGENPRDARGLLDAVVGDDPIGEIQDRLEDALGFGG
jgi:MFS family permease